MVAWRMETGIPSWVKEELCDKIPDFQRAWENEGLQIEEYEKFGPVQHFRNSFIKGGDYLTETIRERRGRNSNESD